MDLFDLLKQAIKPELQMQKLFLDFIDSNEGTEEQALSQFANYIEIENYLEGKKNTLLFLQIINVLSNSHQRKTNIHKKIFTVLSLFKKNIEKNMEKKEIINIMKRNLRILHFLMKENIIDLTDILNQIAISRPFLFYFAPELIKHDRIFFFNKAKTFGNFRLYLAKQGGFFEPEGENSESATNDIKEFIRKRNEGENDEEIAEIIRKDNIDEFISYTAKNCIDLNKLIPLSFFDPNNEGDVFHDEIILTTSYINYAAFFGSIQIFKFLFLQHVVYNESLPKLAIFGRNYEILYILEEGKNESIDFEKMISTAIRCHHNEIADYYISLENENCEDNQQIEDLGNESESGYKDDKFFFRIEQCLKFYNFKMLHYMIERKKHYLAFKKINNILLLGSCRYCIFGLAKYIIDGGNFDINCRDKFEKTSLHCAVISHQTDIVVMLLKHKIIDINTFDEIFFDLSKYFYFCISKFYQNDKLLVYLYIYSLS